MPHHALPSPPQHPASPRDHEGLGAPRSRQAYRLGNRSAWMEALAAAGRWVAGGR